MRGEAGGVGPWDAWIEMGWSGFRVGGCSGLANSLKLHYEPP
jgi:hypothetical protein